MKIRDLIVMAALAAAASIAQAQAPAAPAPAPKGAVPGNAAVSPQGAGESSDDNAVATFRVPVNEVNVIFTVTDKHGRFIKNLTRDDFTVLDDKKPPKSIDLFRSETDLPLRVGLLIDASNSIRDRFRFEQQAAIEFMASVIRQNDRAFVIGFDTTPEVTQDFTSDTEKLADGVRMLRPGGGTALWDAVYFACRDKLMKTRETGAVRRAIILLTDGADNQSHVTRQEALEMAQRAEVIVYAISTNVSGNLGRDDKVLEKFAEATGGRAFFPFQIEDVAQKFMEIQDELRSQYQVAYKPADFLADGRYRTIQILAKSDKKLKVRARTGYYAPTK
jgi:Ca-activated chloride channel family protein